MSKGDRKRTNGNGARDRALQKISRDDATPIQQNEAYLFKELVDQSNLYGKLMQQFQEMEFQYQNLAYKRKQIQKGEIEISASSPVLVPLIGNALCPITDKKHVLKDIDTQLTQLKLQKDGVKGQMLHRRDEYIESALRLRKFLDERYGKYVSTVITAPAYPTGVRVSSGREEEKKNDQTLFEAEYNKIMNDAETQEKFKEAIKKAKDDNEKLGK